VLEALARTQEPVRVKFSGTPDLPSYINELQNLARKLRVRQRVEWLGQVGEDEKRRLYAESRGVLYPPIDEDYGYVTLEAMLAAKPVITCTDSGGPLEFVKDNETGLVAEPTAESLAARMDQLWKQQEQAREWGRRGRALYDEMGISWTNVVRTLLAQKS
jgi:glycosyltransferase involved in cell wall biosynthesis